MTPKLRGFFDPTNLREWVKDKAKSAFDDKLNKIETDTHKLVLKDLGYRDRVFTIPDQKQAILDRKDITLPLMGTFQLVDKRNNQIVDEKTTIVSHVPYITERNSTIMRGSEAVPINQSRLREGIYTRIKENNEVEAHINPLGSLNGTILFHPQTLIFEYKIGSVHIKLYGLLKDLGVDDSTMLIAWGKDILARNKATYKGDEIDKIYKVLYSFG